MDSVNSAMMHIIEQTREEKVEMYMRLTKRELVGMLLANQEALERERPGRPSPPVPALPRFNRLINEAVRADMEMSSNGQ